jgi:hypothetical protein
LGGILASMQPERFKGLNVKTHAGLLSAAEKYPPDYSLFPDLDYSLTFTSRGCVRQCPFCVVWRMEPKFECKEWWKDIDLTKKEIIFMDNNWFAKKKEDWLKDVKILKEMKKKGINRVDFNQGLDSRIFTEWHAKNLYGIPVRPIRFAFDSMAQDGFIQNAIKLAKKYHFVKIRIDVLYNFTDTPDDFYYRLKELMKLKVTAIPMKFAPLDKIDRKYVGKHWTRTMVRNFDRLNPYSQGKVCSRDIKEFEHFFGKNSEDFKKLLNYPNVGRLTTLKMNKLKRDKAWNHTSD